MLELPAIDLSSSTASIASQIRNAHEECGFFRVINHGVPLELLRKVLELQKDFFEQTLDYKSKFAVDPGYRREGYNAAPTNIGLKIKREHLYLFLLPLSRRSPNKWPDTHKDLIEELALCSMNVYEKLIVALSEALNLDLLCLRKTLSGSEDIIKQTFCTFRYPSHEKSDEEVFGVPEHTDIGTLVLLFADDVPSLQVLLKDGQWQTVKPDPDSFIVSFGEILEVMSNGIYRATPHRVILDEERVRYSSAVTFEPLESAQIGPVSSLLEKNGTCNRYRRFTYGERYREYEQGKFLKRYCMNSS